MESKKINQLATNVAPQSTDLTIIGDPITGVSKKITWLQVSTLIGTAANLQQVTDNGATTTNPIAIGGLTITGLATGVLKSDSGVISSVPFGAANGVATLGGDGKVPSIQLPSYVDDVVEVANFAALPATGETGKIYITLDNNKVYRWTGSTYVEIAANNAVWGAITGTLSNQTDLQSALNARVPYTGATSNVDLGIRTLTANTLKTTGNQPLLIDGDGGSNNGGIAIRHATTQNLKGANYTNINASGTTALTVNHGIASFQNKTYKIEASGLTDEILRTFTLPDASGTLALTSDIPSLTGYVPYTGATTNVNLGTFDLTADVITAETGSFASSGGIDTFAINHSSGSGIALNITKGGNGEGLYINKTSGSGNAATIIGTLNATTLVKSGGTSSQFLKADGSVDSNTYLTTGTASSTYVPYSGATTNLDMGANGLYANNLTIRKNGTKATIDFPNTGSQLDPAFIQHDETTIDTGIMRFSVSDNDTSADYFVFGNVGGGGGAYVERFKILANGIITLGTWNATAISDTYISSASTWNAKQNALNGTGFVKASGTTITYDNSTYLTTSSATSTYLPYTGATASLEMGTGSLGIQAGQFILFNRAGSNTLGAGAYQGFVDAAQSNGIYLQLNASNNLGIFGRISGADTSVGFISATGSFNGSSFVPTGSTIPANGMYLSAANTLNFATNTTNRLSISSAGIITAPSQVSFKAYFSGSNPSITKSVITTLPYNAEDYDTQGNFNTSTYRFTAPVAGKYLFTVNTNTYGLDDTASLRLLLFINSTNYRTIFWRQNMATGNTGDILISGSDILNLAANDTVEVRIISDGSGTYNLSGGLDYNSFSGHLLG
jgi:hypothetical protein